VMQPLAKQQQRLKRIDFAVGRGNRSSSCSSWKGQSQQAHQQSACRQQQLPGSQYDQNWQLPTQTASLQCASRCQSTRVAALQG
jgi:hypothetical protein